MIESTLKTCLMNSDMTEAGLKYVAETFALAHRSAPGGLSLEIGTRLGGSALLQLEILDRMYIQESRPFLFTIDPYGGKPYQGGDGRDHFGKALYGDAQYVAMKTLLARFPNHAHWYMESLRFLKLAPCLAYWSHSYLCYVKDFSFVLLDGEHKWETVAQEVEELIPLMNRKGIILIDNFDRDSGLHESLKKYAGAMEPSPTHFRTGDLQVRIMMEKL